MQKSLFSVLVYFVLAAPCFSQIETSEKKVSKWEIGVDLLPLIDTSYFLKNSILVKKRISETVKLRSRLGVSFYEYKNRPNTKPQGNIDILSGGPLDVYASLGYEKYIRTTRISIFWGVEGFGSFFRFVDRSHIDTSPNASPATIFILKDYYSAQKYGLNGLLGCEIYIVPYLSISVDSLACPEIGCPG